MNSTLVALRLLRGSLAIFAAQVGMAASSPSANPPKADCAQYLPPGALFYAKVTGLADAIQRFEESGYLEQLMATPQYLEAAKSKQAQ